MECGCEFIRFLKPCLHRSGTLVRRPEKDEGITTLTGRRLEDFLGKRTHVRMGLFCPSRMSDW
jgi:hypothetical protein